MKDEAEPSFLTVPGFALDYCGFCYEIVTWVTSGQTVCPVAAHVVPCKNRARPRQIAVSHLAMRLSGYGRDHDSGDEHRLAWSHLRSAVPFITTRE
jgi:hypothetical protein